MALSLVLLVLFFVPSCTKKTISSEPTTTISAEEQARRRAEEEAKQKALREEDLKEESMSGSMAGEQAQESENLAFENEDIYFEFDSIRLTPEAQEILTKKSKWLREHPQATVTIEGHCDNRGTNEYNLALGEGRAQSAKAFLIDLGIEESRLNTISYGEERPLNPEQTEEAWALNRRGHFVIEE
jgi:peptidoglycan-associated lipoprotein